MLVATLKDDRKIAIAFCHPEGHRARGKGLILETSPYRKTICELFEVTDVKAERKWLCSATKKWNFPKNHKFKKDHGPKELMRLETLAKAVDKIGETLSKDDKEKIFDTYLMRRYHGGGPHLGGMNGNSAPTQLLLSAAPHKATPSHETVH